MIVRKCPFCQQELYSDGVTHYAGTQHLDYEEYYKYFCSSISCMVNNDFPRYVDILDVNGNIVEQEYALGNYYVKVGKDNSRIYRLEVCMLHDEVNIGRSVWLNPTNLDQTLDKLKMWVIFS